jgi:hypothetical protein
LIAEYNTPFPDSGNWRYQAFLHSKSPPKRSLLFAATLQLVEQFADFGLRPHELWVVFRVSKKGGIQVLQRIRSGQEICLAFPFCLDDKFVNVIPLLPSSKETPDKSFKIDEPECSHKGQFI